MNPTPPPAPPVANPNQPPAAAVVAVPIKRRPVRTVARHFWKLDAWKKALLVVALLVGIAGVAGSVAGMVRPDPPAKEVAIAKVESLQVEANRRSLTDAQRQQVKEQLSDAYAQASAAGHWFYDKTAPHLWRIGLGFSVAFVLGYMARQFVKTVAVVAALMLILAGVAIYFGQLDGSKVGADLRSGAGWVADRSTWIKEQLIAIGTASISGTIGFVIGFTRQRG